MKNRLIFRMASLVLEFFNIKLEILITPEYNQEYDTLLQKYFIVTTNVNHGLLVHFQINDTFMTGYVTLTPGQGPYTLTITGSNIPAIYFFTVYITKSNQVNLKLRTVIR